LDARRRAIESYLVQPFRLNPIAQAQRVRLVLQTGQTGPLHQELGRVFWEQDKGKKRNKSPRQKEEYATLVDSRDILAKIVQTVTSLNPS
jgi:hypothetical protein